MGAAGSPIDPSVGPLAVNAPGTTATRALLPGSPAIDAGDDAMAAAAVGYPNYGAGGLDQRGVARPQGTHSDIGAYEYIPTGFTSYTAPANGSANIYTLKLSGSDIQVLSGGNVLQSGAFDPSQPFVFNGEDNWDDTLIIDFSGGNPIPTPRLTYNGGAFGHDTMTLSGGAFGTVTYTFTNLNDGSVSLGSYAINYTGLEPIIDNLSVTDRVFTFNGGAEPITLSDSGTPGQTTISSTASESVTFTNPTNSLTINAGTGNDIINITDVGSGYNASLTINGDAGTDAVNLTGALSMGSNALTINAESFTHSGAFTGGSGALTVSGSVTISGGTLTAPTGNFAVGGDWTYNGGTFTHNSGTVTFTGTTTISGSVATTFNNITIDVGGTLTAHSGTTNIAGSFTNSGAFNHNNGTVAFTSGATQNLTANQSTQFKNLTVSAGTTLVETVSADNVTVSGTLTNNGIIHKSQALVGLGGKTFGLTGVSMNVATMGSLSNLQVDRVDSNYAKVPVAPNTGLQTGRNWTVTP
ncbi:MAG: choice-of-anchor Q domain-containing protein, partial [Chloroflexota bacterium]